MQHRALAHTLRTTSDEKRRENGAEASRQRPELAVDQRDPIHEEWGNVTAPKHDISLSITIAAPPCTVGWLAVRPTRPRETSIDTRTEALYAATGRTVYDFADPSFVSTTGSYRTSTGSHTTPPRSLVRKRVPART
ncbi:hypothetical protein MRX96_036960 [Rhipicephalus microplus]